MLNKYMDDSMLLATLDRYATPAEAKEAAICAFVLARKCQELQAESPARHFAEKCIELLREYPTATDTLEQCAHPYVTVGGVLIPGLFHEGTVRRELAAVLR